MKKFPFLCILLVIVLLCLCTMEARPLFNIGDKKTANNNEFVLIMDEVNSDHREVTKTSINRDRYAFYFPERKETTLPAQPDTELRVEALNKEQAMYDIEYLCWYLSKNYSLYDYWGGDKVFDEAKNKMISHIEKQASWTVKEIRDLLFKSLSFIQDCHFVIDGYSMADTWYPIFYTDIKFLKTENSYITSDGREVLSINDEDNLDNILKLSLSLEGDVVYYPIVFVKNSELESASMCALKVIFKDGELLEMYPQKYNASFFDTHNGNDVNILSEDGIDQLYFTQFNNNKLSDTAQQLKESPVVLINLLSNTGGNSKLGYNWWEIYTECEVPSNFVSYTKGEDVLERNTELDTFVLNDNLTVMLVSKYTASAAESFIDRAYNVENTLIIGENTRGCLLTDQSAQCNLRYSGIYIAFGTVVRDFPDDYFEECYGYEPDLWCPASEAEEAAINFIKKNVQVSE